MKKIAVALMLSMSLGLATSAQAADLSLLAVYAIGAVVGTQVGNPVPYNLTDACKVQSVKHADGNYNYSSVDHCVKN